jgi:hypothetical protein
VVEELSRDDRADGVAPEVLGAGGARAVANEPGQRVGAARFEVAAEDVALCHAPIIAP